jgi:hypothetical protein
MPIRPKAEKKRHPTTKAPRTRRKDIHHGGAETQRSVKVKDARHKRREHGGKMAVVCGLSVLALGPP